MNRYKAHGNGREQAGMSREGRRMMEKVLENTVHDMDRTWDGASLSRLGFSFLCRRILIISVLLSRVTFALLSSVTCRCGSIGVFRGY